MTLFRPLVLMKDGWLNLIWRSQRFLGRLVFEIISSWFSCWYSDRTTNMKFMNWSSCYFSKRKLSGLWWSTCGTAQCQNSGLVVSKRPSSYELSKLQWLHAHINYVPPMVHRLRARCCRVLLSFATTQVNIYPVYLSHHVICVISAQAIEILSNFDASR